MLKVIYKNSNLPRQGPPQDLPHSLFPLPPPKRKNQGPTDAQTLR